MLHGKKFEELDGKEFIYKKPSKDNLSVIQNNLREAFAGRVGGVAENVMVLPNSEVDRTKLDPEKVYLQLASVNPYFDALEWENRSTAFDRNFNTSTSARTQATLARARSWTRTKHTHTHTPTHI